MTTPAAGVPVYADTPALDLANTIFVSRGKNLDALADADELATWIGRVAPQLAVARSNDWPDALSTDDSDVERFHRLRDAVRSLATDLTDGGAPQTEAIEALNAAAAVAPQRARLTLSDDETPRKEVVADAPAMRILLSAFAEDAIDLFGGDRRGMLRSCQAPNCPLFFLKDHARREWCGPTCGNRVRAARAYRKRVAAAAAG